MPVRIAKPKPLGGFFEELDDPAYSTLVGLVLYGAGESTIYEIDSNGRLRTGVIEDEVDEPLTEEALQSREQELELLDEMSQFETFKEEKESVKEKIVKSFRWLTRLF